MTEAPDARMTSSSSGVEINTTYIISSFEQVHFHFSPHRLGIMSDCLRLAGRADARILSFSSVPLPNFLVDIVEDAGENTSRLLSRSFEAGPRFGIFSLFNTRSH